MLALVPKILIIDDSDVIRDSLRDVMEDAGFHAVLADDGRHGLAALLAEPFDAVLLDLQMPVMDGFEFLRRKADSVRAGVPVVVFSGQAPTGPLAGAFAVVQKPCRLAKLLEVVHAALQERAKPCVLVDDVA